MGELGAFNLSAGKDGAEMGSLADRLYLANQRRLRAMLHEKGLQGEWILLAQRSTFQQQSQLVF